jgi:hypothetical protein
LDGSDVWVKMKVCEAGLGTKAVEALELEEELDILEQPSSPFTLGVLLSTL